MSDIERIREGGTTEFNSNLQVVERLHFLTVQANNFSMEASVEGLRQWFSVLQCMDREISPLLSEKEGKDLATARKKAALPTTARLTHDLLRLEREELDAYERKIRYYVYRKGLGVRAKEDAGAAILR